VRRAKGGPPTEVELTAPAGRRVAGGWPSSKATIPDSRWRIDVDMEGLAWRCGAELKGVFAVEGGRAARRTYKRQGVKGGGGGGGGGVGGGGGGGGPGALALGGEHPEAKRSYRAGQSSKCIFSRINVGCGAVAEEGGAVSWRRSSTRFEGALG